MMQLTRGQRVCKVGAGPTGGGVIHMWFFGFGLGTVAGLVQMQEVAVFAHGW